MPSSTTFTPQLKYIIFSILFITVCSPLHATTANTTTPTSKATNTVSVNKNRENAIQHWINARTEYEETLDYSSLELENKYKYKTMRILAEAKYFLTLAEKDFVFNTDKSVALDDFSQARELLDKAATMASTENKQKIEIVRDQLDGMRHAVNRDIASEARWLPLDQREKFDSIQSRIEHILDM